MGWVAWSSSCSTEPKKGWSLYDLSMLAQRAASEGARWTRAVEDQSAPIPEEITSKLGGIIFIVPTRTIEDQSGYPVKRGASKIGRMG